MFLPQAALHNPPPVLRWKCGCGVMMRFRVGLAGDLAVHRPALTGMGGQEHGRICGDDVLIQASTAYLVRTFHRRAALATVRMLRDLREQIELASSTLHSVSSGAIHWALQAHGRSRLGTQVRCRCGRCGCLYWWHSRWRRRLSHRWSRQRRLRWWPCSFFAPPSLRPFAHAGCPCLHQLWRPPSATCAIHHPRATLQHRTLLTIHHHPPTSPSFTIRHPSAPAINHQPATTIPHPSPPSVIHHPPSLIHHPPLSANHPPSSSIHHSQPSAIHFPEPSTIPNHSARDAPASASHPWKKMRTPLLREQPGS